MPALLIAFAALAVAAGLAPSCIRGGETTDAGPAHPVGRAVSFGGPGQEFGQAIATWGSATFLAGRYEGALRLGSTSFTAPARSAIFVARLDHEGVPVWAVSSRGKTSVDVKAMDVDTAGNVYIVGDFTDKLVLGTDSHYMPHGDAAFVARLDPAGNWTWSLKSSGSSATPYDVATDSSGLLVVGCFRETMEIDSAVVTSISSHRDAFVLNVELDGRVSWLRRAGGPTSDSARGVALDRNGNGYVTGTVSDHATLGTLSLSFTHMGSSDVFVAEIDRKGTFRRARLGLGGTGIAFDARDNLYVSGTFDSNDVLVDCTMKSYGESDTYVMRVNPSQLTVDWCRSAGSGARDGTISVAAGPHAIAYSGFTGGSMDFGTLRLSDSGMFLAAATLQGEPLWLAGGIAEQNGFSRDLAFDKSGNLFVTGGFGGTGTFGTTTLKAHGDADIFVWRTRLP